MALEFGQLGIENRNGAVALREKRTRSLPPRAERLGVVPCSAAWGSVTDPRTEIPPRGLWPHRHRRRPPDLFGDEEIERFVAQAAWLPSAAGLRGPNFATLFGLPAASGPRLGEALVLDVADVDLGDGLLAVRKTQFGNSRFVPLHDSTRRSRAPRRDP